MAICHILIVPRKDVHISVLLEPENSKHRNDYRWSNEDYEVLRRREFNVLGKRRTNIFHIIERHKALRDEDYLSKLLSGREVLILEVCDKYLIHNLSLELVDCTLTKGIWIGLMIEEMSNPLRTRECLDI